MKEANLYSINGEVVGKVKLPKVFSTPIREDLIKRAFLATQSKKRQPYGTDVYAGKRTSAHYHGRRRLRAEYLMMDREMARHARIHGNAPPHMMFVARRSSNVRKGMRAHPPKVEKVWEQKINKKERRLAIASAIAATAVKELVQARGHKVQNLSSLPIVVEDDIQKISKTKELVEFLKKIGLEEELKRIKKKKVRAGKGKMRGRRYRKRVGILFVVDKDEGIGKAIKNLPGCHVVRVENLSAEYLAPGAHPGRLTIFTKSAIERLGEIWQKLS